MSTPKLRHVVPTDYNGLYAAVGFGRGRFGSARSTKTMEEELAARAPKHGEGQLSKPDPWIGKTIQPDAEQQLPPEFQLERQREGAAAYGVALQETVSRVPQHDEMLAEHLDLSYDGETVSHDKLHDGITASRRASTYLGIVLVVVGAVSSLALLLAGFAHAELGPAARQMQELRQEMQELRAEVERLQQGGQ